jgi:hypothetical protein
MFATSKQRVIVLPLTAALGAKSCLGEETQILNQQKR